MTVSIISLRAHGAGDEVAVVFEIREAEACQRETLVLSSADVADLRLSKGEVSEDCYDAILNVSKRHSARKRAMQILSYGRCSERRLAKKLRLKGIDASIARDVAGDLAEEGYLDEQGDALREAERAVAKLWGEKRIVADLRAKGYEVDAIRGAMESLRESVNFSEVCAQRIQKSFGCLSDDPGERQKQIASLERAGFSFSQIREAGRQ